MSFRALTRLPKSFEIPRNGPQIRKVKTTGKDGSLRHKAEDAVTAEEELKDPFVLEFLGLKDECSKTEMEEALIRQLETFLLELGGDFTFVGRQRRLRVGDAWTLADENPPVGLILCDRKDDAVAHYSLDGLPSNVLAARYKMALPSENRSPMRCRKLANGSNHADP